jgi:phage shock protein E
MIIMKNIFHLLTLSLLLGFATSCKGIYENGSEMAADCSDQVSQICVKTLQAKVEEGGDFYLIDVRQPSDYYTGNIPGSVLIARGVLEFKIDDMDFWSEQYIYPPEKDTEIIVYSENGDLGILAAKSLMQLGFTNVYNLEGGYKAFNPNQDPNAKPVTPGAGCGG